MSDTMMKIGRKVDNLVFVVERCDAMTCRSKYSLLSRSYSCQCMLLAAHLLFARCVFSSRASVFPLYIVVSWKGYSGLRVIFVC
jgi:hypothetical protein